MHKQLVLEASLDSNSNKRDAYEKTIATLSSTELLRHQGDITLKDVVLEPQEILALFASQKQQEKGEIVMLRDIHCQNQNIFLVVDTTCPLPRSERPPTPAAKFDIQPTIHEDSDNDEENANERKRNKRPSRRSQTRQPRNKRASRRDPMDQSNVPDWIREEIAEAESEMPKGGSPSRRPPLRSRSPSPPKRSPLKRQLSEEDHIKRLEREFDKKKQELLLEAENVVRMREEAFNQELIKLQTELEKQKLLQQESLEKVAASKNGKDVPASSSCAIQ